MKKVIHIIQIQVLVSNLNLHYLMEKKDLQVKMSYYGNLQAMEGKHGIQTVHLELL